MNRSKMGRMSVLSLLIIAGALQCGKAAPAGQSTEAAVEGIRKDAAEGVALDASDASKEPALDSEKKTALNLTGDQALDVPTTGPFAGAAFEGDGAAATTAADAGDAGDGASDGAGGGDGTTAAGGDVSDAGDDGNGTNTGEAPAVTGGGDGGGASAAPGGGGTKDISVCSEVRRQCCYNLTHPIFEVKTPGSEEFSTATTIVPESGTSVPRILIVKNESEVCFKCVGSDPELACNFGDIKPIPWIDSVSSPDSDIPVCEETATAGELVEDDKAIFGCTWKKDEKQTERGGVTIILIHKGDCPLPPFLPGARMTKYSASETEAEVTYKCKKDAIEVKKKCKDGQWTDGKCKEIECEDMDTGCDVFKPRCTDTLYIMENCIKTCDLCGGGGGGTGGNVTGAPGGDDATDQQAKATDAADRTLSMFALTIILPLITCAWM